MRRTRSATTNAASSFRTPIERASRSNPALKLVFISPATQNPRRASRGCPRRAPNASIESDVPTVLQNVIVAEQVPRKPKLWNLSVRQHAALLPLGVLQLASCPPALRSGWRSLRLRPESAAARSSTPTAPPIPKRSPISSASCFRARPPEPELVSLPIWRAKASTRRYRARAARRARRRFPLRQHAVADPA